MADNSFNSTVESLFKGMDSFLTTKTVVGDAIKFDDGTIILHLVDVSFGVAAGAFAEDSKRKNNGGGGLGGKISPSSILVIQNGSARLVNIKNQDVVTKVLDMVPDFVNKFSKDKKEDEDIMNKINNMNVSKDKEESESTKDSEI